MNDATRALAPSDYVFGNFAKLLLITADGKTLRAHADSESVERIMIRDENYFRTLYTRADGFTIPGYEDLTEASQRDRLKPFSDEEELQLEPLLVRALVTGISRNVFRDPGLLDIFLHEGARYLRGDLSLLWANEMIETFLQFADSVSDTETIGVSHALEKAKIETQPVSPQLELIFNEARSQKKYGFARLQLNEAEEDALLAVQTLLADNGYHPNFRMDGKEAFYFDTTELLEAAAVPRKRNKFAKMEFDKGKRNRVIRGFLLLCKRRFALHSGMENMLGGDRRIDVALTSPLWLCQTLFFPGLKGSKKRVRGYALLDYHHALIPDHDSRTLFLPRYINRELKRIVGLHYTIFHRRFMSFILTQANEKRLFEKTEKLPADWSFEVSETRLLTEHLQMHTYVKARQRRRIERILHSCFDCAQKMGFISATDRKHTRREQYYILTMNRERFAALKNWNLEKRERLVGYPEVSTVM